MTYAQKVKLRRVYSDVALFSRNTYKMETTVGTELTILYIIASPSIQEPKRTYSKLHLKRHNGIFA